MPEKPERNVEAPEKPDRPSGKVALPPIDATPEEIAHALFQRPPLKKPKDEDSGESPGGRNIP